MFEAAVAVPNVREIAAVGGRRVVGKLIARQVDARRHNLDV